MSLDPDAFRALLGRFATGVTVVTTTDDAGQDHGMTVSAFSSVSLQPPLVLICIEHTASAHDALVSARFFVVNILASTQELLARHFAEQGTVRFTGVGFTRGERGAPVLDGVLGHIECRRTTVYEGGDHSIILGETETAAVGEGEPLLYYRGGFAQLAR